MEKNWPCNCDRIVNWQWFRVGSTTASPHVPETVESKVEKRNRTNCRVVTRREVRVGHGSKVGGKKGRNRIKSQISIAR